MHVIRITIAETYKHVYIYSIYVYLRIHKALLHIPTRYSNRIVTSCLERPYSGYISSVFINSVVLYDTLHSSTAAAEDD